MNQDETVRVGVVGLGWFGRTHLDAWASVHGAAVVGVCDRNPAALNLRVQHAQDDFHVDTGTGGPPVLPADLPRFTTLDALLHSGIDLLDVVVSEDGHEECVRSALEAGVDVVVEKPLALDLDAAINLIRLAERLGRRIYVGQILRFDTRHVALAEMTCGRELRHLSLSRHFQTTAHNIYGRVHPVLNAAVHDIDLALWLVGRAPDRVTAFSSHFLGREHPDVVDLVLDWDGGLRAVVQNSWHLATDCPYGFVFDCTVHTAGGTFAVRNEPMVQAWSDGRVAAPELFFWPRSAGSRGGALVAELQHFRDRTACGEASERVPLKDVLAVLSTCQAAVTALETGQTQQVQLPTARKEASSA